MKRNPERKSGAALIESCVVLMILCLILFGVLQVSYLVGARDVLAYTSMASARSAQVGLNDFMLEKTARVMSIPTAGPILNPSVRGMGVPDGLTAGQRWDNASAFGRGVSGYQYRLERGRIPHYLGAEYASWLPGILDYDNWQTSVTTVQVTPVELSQTGSDILDVGVAQQVPMVMPFARFYALLVPSVEIIPVFRSDKRGLAENGYGANIESGTFSVPSIRMATSLEVENHAAYYLGGESE